MMTIVKLMNTSITHKTFLGGEGGRFKINCLSTLQGHSMALLAVVAMLHIRASALSVGDRAQTLLLQILIRLSKLCVQEGAVVRKSRKQQQRLLRNMSAHAVVLELLQIPYEKVRPLPPSPRSRCIPSRAGWVPVVPEP